MVQIRAQQIQDGGRPPFWKIEKWPYLSHGWTYYHKICRGDAHCPNELYRASPYTMLTILHNKTNCRKLHKQNWFSFSLLYKPPTLKRQTSKYYLQILSIKSSFYIYDRLLADINAIDN